MIAGPALSLASGVLQGAGQAAGYRHQEAQAQRRGRAARIAADETDTALREELNTTLGNILAIRASANTDPSSPTQQAIISRETEISDRQRRIRTNNLLMQGQQSEADAAYYGQMAPWALGTGILSGLGGALRRL